jgi:predicted ABC-type ATPase
MTYGNVTPPNMSTKSIQPAFMPRDNDPDVFIDIESARKRAQQLGCIGVSRRMSKGGKTVWMPCTNLTDYNNLTGMTSLGRINQAKRNDRVVRTVIKDELKRRKKSIPEEILGKSLGPKLRGVARAITDRFDPNALDGDNDGLLQDSTPFERPNVPNVNTPQKIRVSTEKEVGPKALESIKNWLSSLSPKEKDDFRSEPIDAFDAVPGLASRSYFGGDKTKPQSVAKPATTIRIDGLDNPEASPTNPFRNLGGRAIGQVIRGLVDPKNRGKKDRKTYILGGNTGSGKTTVLDSHLIPKGLVPSETEAAIIDPDFVKKALPGYDDGAGAGRVHGQSQTVTDKIIRDSANDGLDMVITGSGASRQLAHIREANLRGESVVGHWVHVPQRVASQRIKKRTEDSGRFIPDNTAHMAASIPRTISASFEEDLLDEFYLWDNDIAEGATPKLIAKKTRGNKFEVYDQAKFEEFAGGKKWADRWVETADDRESRAGGLASYNGSEAWSALEKMGFFVDYGDGKNNVNVKVYLPEGTPVKKFFEKNVLPYMIDKSARTNAHASRGGKDGEVIINMLLKTLGIDVDRKNLTNKNNIKKFKTLLASSDPEELAKLFARAPINGPNGESRFGDLKMGQLGIEINKNATEKVLENIDALVERTGIPSSQLMRLVPEGYPIEDLFKMSTEEIQELLQMLE